MQQIVKAAFFCFLICLGACSSQPIAEQAITPIFKADDPQDEQRYKHFIGHPTPDAYSICLHNTCQDIAFVTLTTREWQHILSSFLPIAATAEQEREQIKQAIALLETFTGQQTLTHLDKAMNNMSYGSKGQMDCIDEATNTTVYLRLIDKAGLLKWHQQASRTSRGLLSGNAPHNTATITETASGQRFAVDSWFEDNGQQPYIVPLDDWKSGWRPAHR